jgi:hypothetical protein
MAKELRREVMKRCCIVLGVAAIGLALILFLIWTGAIGGYCTEQEDGGREYLISCDEE